MMNYFLTIKYDGTNYAGWQIQNNAITVQQTVANAVKILTKKEINLIGSGRTDAGVHSLGQVANFRIDEKLDLHKFQHSMNALLPNDISIAEMREVEESFHARFDARSRSYLYLISRLKSPFYYKYSHYYPRISKIDFKTLNKISSALLGEHDFTSFSKKNSEPEDKRCTVNEIHWREGKEISIFHIKANRFLHGMVRTVVGTILFAAENGHDEKYILNVLDKKNREAADESVPAKGLFLFKVRY